MANRKNNIELRWGGAETEMFLLPTNRGIKLLDYEFDHDLIHKMCGGKCYYTSRSGLSGAGYLDTLGELTRVGYYRVDTTYSNFQEPVEIAKGINLMIPYVAHCNDEETLENYPVVITIGVDTVIYADFYRGMEEIIETILSGKELDQEPQILRRKFVNKCFGGTELEMELKFYNLFGERSFYPWEFAGELLKDCWAPWPVERIQQIFRISQLSSGNWVRTSRIADKLYGIELLDSDPLEELETPFPGWELAENNMLYKVRENDVYIIGWKLAAEAYQKKVERIARFIPASEAEEFKTFVIEHLPKSKYVEFELSVPKLLFFMNKEKQFASVRKGIAKKVREDVIYVAKQFIADFFNDKQILEAIPDDLVITLEDSWSSGNCKPGTQAFVDKYFPGKSEATAGELKKHADNWNVMRIFRYIAARDMISGKVKLELPA